MSKYAGSQRGVVMFSKLHRQMACFCTLITASIFVALSLLCLFFAQNFIRQNGYASFLKEQSTLTANLQNQNIISHQWLNQMQQDHHLSIYLYDNGTPIYYQQLQHAFQNEEQSALVSLAIDTAQSAYGLDIFRRSSSLSALHEEFPLSSESGKPYYASVGILPRSSGQLSFVILYSLADQARQIFGLRIIILLADAAALILLFVFSWLFTGHILKPVEESRKKQSQFIASASHELRSPLAVILSGAESIEKADTPAQARHFLSLIRSEGTRMQHLISDMLLLAGSDSHALQLHMKCCQPDELLLQVYEGYQALARERQISLQLLLPEETPDCWWDEERMRQILSILVDNALSYTPSGKGILLFLLGPGKPNRKKAMGLLFGVADQGPGIPAEDKERIFTRFYRSQHSRTQKEHFGLGLSIAKEIALAHQGEIWAEDLHTLPQHCQGQLDAVADFCRTESCGTVFWVWLPEDGRTGK